MLLTIQKILQADKIDLACVPLGKGRCVPICGMERETLEQFSDVPLDVSPEALPLKIYLMGGNRRTLAIFPNLGGIIKRPKGEVEFNKPGYKLCIFPVPHKEEYRK